MPIQRRDKIIAEIAAAVIVVAGAAWLLAGELGAIFGDLSSPQDLRELIVSSGLWAPIASIALMIVHSLVPFPAELLAIANGMVFGLATGLFLTWFGAMCGAFLAFAIARWAGDKWVRRLLGEARWRTMRMWIDERGTGGLLAVRLTPVISFNLINYAAGLAGVGWWKFTWTTAIGILPIATASVLVGSHMIEAPAWLWVVVGTAAIIFIVKNWTGHFQRRPAKDSKRPGP
ncbi:MAG: TVP38/TMEM64 family protein [Hyphomicrobiales bacterium]|nr:TVP38/TMEM64 family protein [Hyphomicrobiales bacterium]